MSTERRLQAADDRVRQDWPHLIAKYDDDELRCLFWRMTSLVAGKRLLTEEQMQQAVTASFPMGG